MPQTTLNFTAAMGSAFAESVGHYRNLGRSATEAECKAFIIDRLKDFHQEQQRAIREAANNTAIPELVMT